MYCPRCSQQLIGDARFCSRCGMPQHLIMEIVANNGMTEAEVKKVKTPRKKGMRLGGIVMFIGVALAPIFIWLSVVADAGEPLIVPAAILFAGFCWLLFSLLFLDDVVAPYVQNQPVRYSDPTPRSFTLLPDRMPEVSAGPRRVNTADMPQSPAVTEHTTQFFD